jgi:anti-anti-sigma factor
MMELRVLSDDGDVLRLQLAGRIVQTEERLESDTMADVLGSGGYARNVVLGLEETEFIDSSGLSWLVVRHKRFCEAGGKLVLHSIPPSVSQILMMMRLELVLNLAEDESTALELIRGGTP